jgi:hypothetical protein
LLTKLSRKKRGLRPDGTAASIPPLQVPSLALTPRTPEDYSFGANGSNVMIGPPTLKLQYHLSLEAAFDGIVSRCHDSPVSDLIEAAFVEFFEADVVFYYHEVESSIVFYF